MQVQVHYQGLESSPWMEQFITRKVSKLNRYVSPSASLQVHLKFENKKYITSLVVHNLNHEYAFTSEGENLYESFSTATDKASRSLSEHKRKIRDKMKHRTSIKEAVA